MTFVRLIWSATTLFVVFAAPARGEPYMAVQLGMKCVACHVNPTGGGKRTGYGNAFAQTTLSARPPEVFWDGSLDERVAIGGDLRANLNATEIPDQEDTLEFELEETLLYLEADLIAQKLTFYLDQQVAPGGATNREAYALYWFNQKTAYVKAGRMFLPYGLRLEDDSAFIRTVPGINYNTPDVGVEAGLELQNWSHSLALTNGTSGGSEVDTGKQLSLHSTFVQLFWRAGFSLNFNEVDGGDRQMANVFGGLKTGIVSWLAQVDYIVDDTIAAETRQQWMSLLEANIGFRQGHNVKLTYEYFEPDIDVGEDERTRTSAVYEYFPLPFTQISAGGRFSDGIPQNDLQNVTEWFVQLHNYF